MRKRIIPFLLALVYTVTAFALPAAAAPPESSSERTYTLGLQLVLKDGTAASAELRLKDVYYSLYKVASMNAKESSGHYVFQLEEEFLEAKAIIVPDESVDPGDPGESGDLGDSGEPGDPDDPGDPGDPGDSGESGDPVEPGDPDDSGNPGDSNVVLDFWSDYTAERLNTMTKGLAGYIEEHGISDDGSGRTDANGKLTFKNLQAGLYLVLGNPKAEGDTTYYPQAALVAVPFYYVEENGWLYHVRIKAKVEKVVDVPDPPSGQQISVRKVWDGTGDHPSSVNVELLRDGKPNRSATLSADNNWSYTWKGLDSGYQWTVRENPVPEGWQVSYTQSGNTFTIINTQTGPGGPGDGPGGGPGDGPGGTEPGDPGPNNPRPNNPGSGDPGPGNPGSGDPGPHTPGPDGSGPDTPPDNPPSGPRLPQTGQLWWPVLLLVGVGVPLLLIGAVLFGRKKGPEEP